MKQNYRFIPIAATVALLAFFSLNAFAQTISYQGELQDNGTPMSGPQSLKITIYTVATGGTPLYTETQSVDVEGGLFNVAIGSVTPLLPTLDFKKAYYLGISVNGGTELTPRSAVSFAPYAFRALNADTASFAINAATASRATVANGLSGGFVSSINGFSSALTMTGTNGITVASSLGNITIGNNGVQSVNTAGGKLTLVGTGGTTITDTGTTITIHSATFSGGTGIQAVQNSDSSITITNGGGPIATITIARQNASSGQVLEWNGSAWKPATLSAGSGRPDSVNDLADAISSDSNIFIGRYSGINDSIYCSGGTCYGNYNTAVGIKAMNNNRSGFENTACGYHALGFNTTGESNSAFGYEALSFNTTGESNSAFGLGALGSNSAGINNTAVGFYALPFDTTGSGNVAIGKEALSNNTTGSNNVAVGFSSLSGGTGNWNTGCGAYSLASTEIGQYNTGIGAWALLQNTSGSNNSAIGDSAGPIAGNLNNTTCLGSGALATASNAVVLGNTNVTSLYCAGAYAATTANSANMVVTATGQIMRSTSSARYKSNIHDLDINTDRLYDLRPVSYTSKIDGKEYFGLVAEDVANVIPDLAEYATSKDVIPGSTSDKLIPDAVKYPMLSVLLLEELKKEHAKVQKEEKELEAQKKVNADMERRLESLEVAQKNAR